jgi:Flp pilus assembly protein TadG
MTERNDRATRGQALVEFTLIVLMMLVLLLGIAEFGRAWMTRNILTGASREAVRVAAVQGNVAAATGRANDILSSAGIVGASVNIVPDGVPFGTCTVNITYDFPLVVTGGILESLGLCGSSIPLAVSTSMREEY